MAGVYPVHVKWPACHLIWMQAIKKLGGLNA